MSELTLTRPNFFPGQLVDYTDFNRLATQPDRSVSLICRTLFQGGGVVVDSLDEFEIVPLKGLTVMIKAGLALLPSGHPAAIEKEQIFDLGEYVPGARAKTVVVALENVVQGRDRYTDESDRSISGYQTEVLAPNLVVSSGKRSGQGVELFRVKLYPETTSLRLPCGDEEWQPVLESNHREEAIIDVRERRRIVPQTYVPATPQQCMEARKALYAIDESHRKIRKLYLVEDKFHTLLYSSQLHAEILSRPFQPHKVSFLMSEMADKLIHFLEFLLHRMGSGRKNFNRDLLLETIEWLTKIRSKSVLPENLLLTPLSEIAKRLQTFIIQAENQFGLLDIVGESLLDIRDQRMEFEHRISLGGHLFEKIDGVQVADEQRWSAKANGVQRRGLKAKFRNGDFLELKGAFLKKGTVSLAFKVPKPELPLLLLTRQYIRRGGSHLSYEINGKTIQSETWEGTEYQDRWITFGLMIPGEILVPQHNVLKVQLEKSDLDFGFFDWVAYQPLVVDKDKGELA